MKHIALAGNLLVLALFLASCTTNDKANPVAENVGETPAVLDDNKADVDITSYSKRSGYSIIDKLFSEAQDKDPNLKALVKEINGMDDAVNDSLAGLKSYTSNMDMYWASVTSHINQISDTLYQKELRDIFGALEKSYSKSMELHNEKEKEIDARKRMLQDTELIMKLVVTEPMMHNYQQNERPNAKILANIVAKYDSLLNRSREYTDIKK